MDVVMMPLSSIFRTEQINEDHARSLAHEMKISGVWTHPLLVEIGFGSLMDGHHRYRAAQLLGLGSVPVIELDYGDSQVHLEAWRPGEHFTPDDIHAVVKKDELLPYKSTRHVIETPIPRCCVPLHELEAVRRGRPSVAPATPQRTRTQRLGAHYHALGKRIGIRTLAAEAVDVETAQTQAPHLRLRQMLQNDPSMAALLPATTGRLGLGDSKHSPFFLKHSNLLLLPPTLLGNPDALAAAARWGLEVLHSRSAAGLDSRRLTGLLRYGAELVSDLPDKSKTLLLDSLPQLIAAELQLFSLKQPSLNLLRWQASLIEGLVAPEIQIEAMGSFELERPVEKILISGGDSRLKVDPRTGFNRYGVPPRPRPEAVHFSSSTASAISDYGFLYCDFLRRDLLFTALQQRTDPWKLRAQATNGVAEELKSLLCIDSDEADVAITASGTDTELVSVMLALCNDHERQVTNILISPAESGRGVEYAAAGSYFDELTSYGKTVVKGSPVWADSPVDVQCIKIRDDDGLARRMDDIDAEFLTVGRQAIASGHTVLAHMLATSKTGLSAPSFAAVEALVALAPDRVEVVVDACQMRWDLDRIGALVRRGWSVQISGSKFLTGPPFSGALVIPQVYRKRVESVGRRLMAEPGTAAAADWSQWWAENLATRGNNYVPDFGPIFRWVPAILEARLLDMLPVALREHAFKKFRTAITQRIENSKQMSLIDVESVSTNVEGHESMASQTIVCFSVTAIDQNQRHIPLDEAACRTIFEWLNVDVSDRFCKLTPSERMIAMQASHIGQPVALITGKESAAILRMVLGARFFNIVGHAGPGAIEAALESEISDAFRALDKLELLAENWWQVNRKTLIEEVAA